MSYILDALKKSDREYQLQQGHNVAQMHYALTGRATQPARWAWVSVCLLLLLCTVTSGLFASGMLQLRLPSLAAVEPAEAMSPVSAEKAALLVPTASLDDADGSPERTPYEPQNPLSGELIAGQSRSLVTSSIDDAIAVDYASLKPLSEAMRERFGPLHFSLHVYSERTDQRSIIINNRMMHEGEWLNPDLLLHAITADGVIMRIGGSYYRMPVIADWQ